MSIMMCFYMIYHPQTSFSMDCFISGPIKYSIMGVKVSLLPYVRISNPFFRICSIALFSAIPMKQRIFLCFCEAIAIQITVVMYLSLKLRNNSGLRRAPSRQGESLSDQQKGIFLIMCLKIYWISIRVCELQNHYLQGCSGSYPKSNDFFLWLQQQLAIMTTSSSTKSLLSFINTFFSGFLSLTPSIFSNFWVSSCVKIEDFISLGARHNCSKYFRSEKAPFILGRSWKFLIYGSGLAWTSTKSGLVFQQSQQISGRLTFWQFSDTICMCVSLQSTSMMLPLGFSLMSC